MWYQPEMANGMTEFLFSSLLPFMLLGGRAYRLPFAIAAMKIKSSNKKPEPKKRFYVCDRTRCENCSFDCRHTTDLKYALYPEYDSWTMAYDGSMWQRFKK